ncbi:MAG: gliding motility-associated C-terminal domain-containing protein, partial [Bacteroidota bacterium]|nr:gliding motility-associated C-terminal domain-containing protein [Bacteroidota bacterium]
FSRYGQRSKQISKVFVLPLSDTLKIMVNIEPPDNTNARFTTPDVTEFLIEGTSKSWPIQAVDDEHDPLIVGVVTDGFDLADVGMEIRQIEQADGSYKAELVWDAYCDIYDFTGRTSFQVKILVEDVDECNFSHPDVMVFHLNVQLPGNADPVISTDLTAEEVEEGISRKMFESLSFQVYGDDADNNPLRLTAQGNGFDLGWYAMNFPTVVGDGHVSSQFDWSLLCDKLRLAEQDTFELMFIVVDDANKCRIYKADTLTVDVYARPPDNQKPLLTVASMNPDLPFENNQQTLYVGQQISLELSSSDPDVAPVDRVVIEMVGAEGTVEPSGYAFEPANGQGSAQTTFVWNPDCSIFENGVYENDYTVTFRSYDDRCQNTKADTVVVEFTIRDYANEVKEFLPPNFVSPDHDPELRNEFFAMVRLKDPATGELEDILPKDNCLGHFVGVTIYNRWGKAVFESTHRDFRWYPEDDAAGVYFYTLTFSDKEFKGSVTVKN